MITLTVPGHSAYLSILRSTATAIGARAELNLDQLDDLRLAVEEASAAFVASETDVIKLESDPTRTPLEVRISGSPTQDLALDANRLAMMVLDATTDHLVVEGSDPVTIRMTFAETEDVEHHGL